MVERHDSESRGFGFDPHWGHRVVSLSKTHSLPRVLINTQLMVASSRHDLKIVEWDIKPQYMQNINPSLAGRDLCRFGGVVNLYSLPSSQENVLTTNHQENMSV